MTIYATTPPTLVDTLVGGSGIPSTIPSTISTIYVPSSSVNAYKSAWFRYSDKIQAIP